MLLGGYRVFGDERAFRRSKSGAPFRFDPVAGNYKMSDITAALALTQLKKIEMLIEWRIKVAIEWDEIIANDPFLSAEIMSRPRIIRDHEHIYQSYVAVCKDGMRPTVMQYMKEKGFQCGIGTHAVHKYCDINLRSLYGGSVARSTYLYENAISFPRYYGLKVKEEWNGASR